LKKPDTGRNGLAPQEVLRSLVLMRVKNWDYRELRERIADGYTLRQFTGFHCRPVPGHNAFHRAFVRLTPATLRVVNDLMVKAAVDLGLEDGTKLRVDTTVVQTDIHYPTDSTLLWDAVRVLSHLLDRLGKLHERRVEGFRNRTRAARRRMQALQRMSATQRLGQQTAKYRELIAIAEEVVAALGPMPVATLDDVPFEEAIHYAARDADATLRVDAVLDRRLDNLDLQGVYRMDIAVVPMVDRMQAVGMRVDRSYFSDLAIYLTNLMDLKVAEIERATGRCQANRVRKSYCRQKRASARLRCDNVPVALPVQGQPPGTRTTGSRCKNGYGSWRPGCRTHGNGSKQFCLRVDEYLFD